MSAEIIRVPRKGLAWLAQHALAQAPALAEELGRRVRAEIEFYRETSVVSDEDLYRSCLTNIEGMFAQLAGEGSLDLASARATGRRRAEQEVPIGAVLRVYRMGGQMMWHTLTKEASQLEDIDTDDLVEAATALWDISNTFSDSMYQAYREHAAHQLLRRTQERAALTEALIRGNIADRQSLWDVADLLTLPYRGPFVVVTAAVESIAKTALPQVEETLQRAGIPSAWQLLPDVQIGVVHIADPAAGEALIIALRPLASGPVGISPSYDDLRETGAAVHVARLAMAGIPAGVADVRVFGDDPVSVVVASAAQTAQHAAARILGPILDLEEHERATLMNTLTSWFEHAGSADAVAGVMFCHPNTVRHRLRRIEDKIGKSLTDPRSAAEIYLALESVRQHPV